MSWSVSTTGKIADVKAELKKQFGYPLADAPEGLGDPGERETVRLVSEAINQCLDTFDPEKSVAVTANGHMGYADWDKKTGGYQEVSLAIRPS